MREVPHPAGSPSGLLREEALQALRDAVGKVIAQVSRHLQTQACFANATCTRECDEAYLWLSQEGTHCLELECASNQRSELRR